MKNTIKCKAIQKIAVITALAMIMFSMAACADLLGIAIYGSQYQPGSGGDSGGGGYTPSLVSGSTNDKLFFTPINNGNAYAVSARDTNIIGEVVIPSSYQGRPVTEILAWEANRSGAFQNCRNITSVVIPNSITVIARGAFYNCGNITTITIGSGVTVIDRDAFYGLSSLNTVTFMGRINNINSSGNFPGDLRTKYQTNGPGTYTRTGTGPWNKR